VAKKVGGSAATAANTAAGKMERMALAIGEAKEGIGAALLPMIEKFLPYLQGMAQWAQDNADALFKLGVVVGSVAGAIVAANVAIKIYEGLQIAMKAATVAWTAAQWLLNAALNANPIGLVVIAITALIAIFVLAYNKVDWFRKLVDTAWAAIQTAIESVVNWFRDTAWPVLKTIFEWIGAAVGLYLTPWKLAFEAIKTVIGVLASAFETAFETIKNVLQSAWDFMRPIFDKIKSAIDAVKAGADFIGGIGGAIGGAFSRSAPVPSSLGAIDPSSRAYVSTGRGAMTSAGTNIVINGAIDPVSTAKQIKRILGTGNMRLGVS
jgi:phage-related protein